MRTVPHDKDPNCIMCSPGVPVEVDNTITLQKVSWFFSEIYTYSCLLVLLHHLGPVSFWTPLSTLSFLFLQFLDQLLKDSRFKLKLSKPSVSYHDHNLYMQAPPVLEEMTRPNLQQSLLDLMDGNTVGVLNINDRRLTGVLRVRVTFKEGLDSIDMDTVGGGWCTLK